MKDKIEKLRGILKHRLENHQEMRIALEEVEDLKNALSYMEKEIELGVVLGLFADVFPEDSEGKIK